MNVGARVRVLRSARGTSLGGFYGTVTGVASDGLMLVAVDGEGAPVPLRAEDLEPAAASLRTAYHAVTADACTGAE